MPTNNKTVYTVGHSNHDIEYFLELLQEYKIDCIVDVRSVPASSYNPQYNREPLSAFLKLHSINYLHFGKEFGARLTDSDYWDEEGRVDFRLWQKSRPFQDGVERVDMGAEKGFRIALMCSEGNPLECHRFSMISGYLEENGMEVRHILKDKKLMTNAELEQAALEKYKKKIPQPSLFEPNVDEKMQRAAAYRLHNQEVGWKSKDGGR